MQETLKLIVIQEPHKADKDGIEVVVACTLCGSKVCHLGAGMLSDTRVGVVVEVVKVNKSWKLLSEKSPNDVSMMLANCLLLSQTKV